MHMYYLHLIIQLHTAYYVHVLEYEINIIIILAHRLQGWPNIKRTEGQGFTNPIAQ